MEKTLSVIVPFRCETESSTYIISRLEDSLKRIPTSDRLEVLVVDSGSKPEYRDLCQAICERNNAKYIYHDSYGNPFSIGVARDFGVENSNGTHITFFDVDFRAPIYFWSRIFDLIDAWGMYEYKKSFFSVPCIYLTKKGVEKLSKDMSDSNLDKFFFSYMQEDKENFESLALCSSVMFVNRDYYMAIGGHDKCFKGHGYEDFELYHRLLLSEKIYEKPRDYYLDKKKWDTYTYSGMRSHISMVGRPAALFGLYIFHLWHPRDKKLSFYSSSLMKENRSQWIDRFKQFVNTGKHPLPLILQKNKDKEYLFIGQENANSYNCIRDAIPHLGRICCINESNIRKKGEDLLGEVVSRISTKTAGVIFPNPYGNAERLKVFLYCRENNIPTISFDRGALPDSWFFDTNGFNYDSKSYNINYWSSLTVDDDEFDELKRKILSGEKTLEKQGLKIGKDRLKEDLGISSNEKILFVPLQRPSDSVIKYFIGNAESFKNFLKVIDELAKYLRKFNWRVVCKKHPLETETPPLKNVIWAEPNTNFIDLLDLADRVLLINSGVGVYSMLMNKQTYVMGNAFYRFDGINVKVDKVKDSEDVAKLGEQIIKGYKIDYSKVQKFISYLADKFYSFGQPVVKYKKEKDGSMRGETCAIDFYKLRLDNKEIYSFNKAQRKMIPLYAPIFERYRLDLITKSNEKKNSKNQYDKNNNSSKISNVQVGLKEKILRLLGIRHL